MSEEKGVDETGHSVFAVFGYGSLLWKQGFEFSTKKTGYIQGFKRKFWQKNCTHRGTEEKVLYVLVLQRSLCYFKRLSYSDMMIYKY